VDFASISVRRKDQTLDTVAVTDELASDLDKIQYELGEGPCYDAVTDERFVVVNDLAADDCPYPRFGPRAVEFGVRAQTAIQLENHGEQAGLNLYARAPHAFHHATMHMAERFSNQAAVLLVTLDRSAV
jgi:GAF domain-containing protein